MPVLSATPPDDPLEFAGYDLVHPLGKGGMGVVWSVLKRGPYEGARALAMKLLLPELSDDAQYQKTFISEGRISMMLGSANIVPVYELGKRDGLLFMLMERVDGVNLSEFQGRTRNVHTILPTVMIGYIIGEILSALNVAHEHLIDDRPAGVLHRDVKPANILVSSTGDVRLTDFGIARPITPNSPRELPQGTWRYMAPEQARGYPERASDLFSVGVILHELLSGTPFRQPGKSIDDSYRVAIGYTAVPDLDHPIPPELERLRRRLLDPNPRRRFRSAAEAMECLAKWPGYGFARPSLTRLYELAIGTRSSGFTEAHIAAPPSFLLKRKKSTLTGPQVVAEEDTFVIRRSELVQGVAEKIEVDEEAVTVHRMPWLRRAAWMDKRGVPVERQKPARMTAPPMIARERWDRATLHRVASEPCPPTERPTGEQVTRAQAITKTVRVVPESSARAQDDPRATASASGMIEASEDVASSPGQAAGDSARASVSRPHGTRRHKSWLPVFTVLVWVMILIAASVSWAIHTGCSTTSASTR